MPGHSLGIPYSRRQSTPESHPSRDQDRTRVDQTRTRFAITFALFRVTFVTAVYTTAPRSVFRGGGSGRNVTPGRLALRMSA